IAVEIADFHALNLYARKGDRLHGEGESTGAGTGVLKYENPLRQSTAFRYNQVGFSVSVKVSATDVHRNSTEQERELVQAYVPQPGSRGGIGEYVDLIGVVVAGSDVIFSIVVEVAHA